MIRNRTPLTRKLAFVGLSSVLSFTSYQALAGSDHSHGHGHGLEVAAATPASLRKAAIEKTESLIEAKKQWAKARGASNKASALENLINKAEARRDLLAKLIKNNPAEVLRVAIPDEKQTRLPEEVLELLEQKVEVEGKLEAIYEDYEDGRHELHHFLITDFGERFELFGVDRKLEKLTGKQIRARGVLIALGPDDSVNDGELALAEEDDSLITLAAGGDGSAASSSSVTLQGTIGEQKTAVVLVNFTDDRSQPWTVDQVRNEVFGQTNDHIQENSSQQTWLSGDVFGWLALPVSGESCDYNSIASAAREAAQNSGVDLSSYNRHMFVFPRIANCGWGGLGTVGGSPSTTWINGSMRWDTISHELGHNFGLYHSHSLDCGSSVIGSNCSSLEYGDITGVMGKGQVHFNAFQKERLGWLDSNSIITVTNSGSFELDTYAADMGSSPKALKVLKETDSTTGDRTWYYLQYRRPTGFDSSLDPFTNTAEGVVVHTGSESNGNTSNLLDMTPETSSWYDPALSVGLQYTDTAAGVTVSTNWVDTQRATVNIDLAPQTCTEHAPSVSATPVQSDWIAAGTSFNYSVTITNRNSIDCDESSFDLSVSKPSGWSANFAAPTVMLMPGESTTVTLTAVSPLTAADGYYSIEAIAASDSNSGQVALTYVVSNPVADNNSPVATSDNVVISSKTSVIIPVLENDHDPDGDSLSIEGFTHGAKGKVTLNGDGTLTYTPSKRFKSSDSFSYTITDGTDNASASVSIHLQSSGDSGDTSGGGGKGNGKKR